MVGTFYGRPSPDEEPFVKEGSEVTAGAPLCLIEVMKLYTTIEATADGVIESILVEEGKLVDFDQPLFIIRNNG
jgi:biotin carboxyl carrier protein